MEISQTHWIALDLLAAWLEGGIAMIAKITSSTILRMISVTTVKM